MLLAAVGLNHQTAPVGVRERLAFSADTLAQALQRLRGFVVGDRGDAQVEAAILSTCNRTEIYCAADRDPRDAMLHWLSTEREVGLHELADHSYRLMQDGTVRHAFRVASGLDSMVLGEPQILGQMKEAVRLASDSGALGSTLNQMFQRTFSVAKEVRTNTEIGAHSVSMAAASVHLAQTVFESLADCRVLFIGAGEMIELVATHFAAHQPRGMVIANRTVERGARLAQRFGAEAIRLADVPQRLPEFDVVVTSTASSLPIIGLGAAERSIKQRRHKPVVMVDLAVPRDIEPEVGKLDDVFLYTVDDLAHVVQDGIDTRHAAVLEAEQIIDLNVVDFMHWMESREHVPMIRALREHAERYRQQEQDRALRLLAKGESPQQVIDNLARALTNKFLHIPTHALNHTAGEDRAELVALLRRLYSLHHNS